MIVKISNLFALVMSSAVMGSGIGYSKLYLFHVAVVIFFLGCIFAFNKNGKLSSFLIVKDKLLWIFYLMFVWYSFSILWSVNPFYTLQYLVYIFFGCTIVLLMNFYITDIHKFLDVFRVLKYSFLLALFIAALEAFTPFRLPTSPYSVYAEFFGRNSVDLVDFENHVQALLRSAPTSFWGNPNTMAVAIVLMLPFFFLTSCVTYRISGVCSILIVVAMAGSRGALIAFIFGLVAYLFIKNAYNILSLFLTVSAIVFFLPNLIDPLKESSSHRISEMARTGEALYIYLLDEDANLGSLGVRQQLISNGMNALWLTNGVGVGGGGSVEIQERLGGVGYKKVSSMHNFWIEVLVDAGIVFFALFMLWYVTVTWRLYRIYKITKDFIYKYHAGALCIAMVIFLIAAVSASSVIYFLPMWLMFGMSTSLIRVYRSQRP